MIATIFGELRGEREREREGKLAVDFNEGKKK